MNRTARLVLDWYERNGRSHLPWRATRDPYAVLVSESMLQQTQVERVVPKYTAFLQRFADFPSLARADAADVVQAWKGLGYNSRAVRLHRLAREVCERFGGQLPSDCAALGSLPGVGPYTIAAVRAFAFDQDGAALDTNIRRVVHRVLFGLELASPIEPARVDARARALVPAGRARDWNSGMMDLGAQICTARAPKCSVCPLARVCAASPVDAKQLEALRRARVKRGGPQARIPFRQTTRFARGRIVDALRELPAGNRISLLKLRASLHDALEREENEFDAIVRALVKDGLLECDGEEVALAR
ncbi:MAG: A/G-specific adenine glycosylase [Candidatus Baltobacteraceae bacterium]